MATEEDLARYLNSPSPPPFFPPASNSMVPYYQGSGQSPMDKLQQNRQQSVSMAAPTNSGDQSEMATEEYLIYWNSPSPSSNSMVVYYQGCGQSSMDNPLQNRQQRPANSGDQSDMATDEHFDVTSLLNLPQWSPPPSPCSSANSMVVYQQGSGQSSMDFVDRPLYIAGDLALLRQKLLQFWTDASEKLGPKGGIMSMKKENLPQSLECLGINLLHLYVEDEFDTLLYWPGEESWDQLGTHLYVAITRLLQGLEFKWVYVCDSLERNDYGQGIFGTERVSIGVWRIGPREWVAKMRYQRHSLESPWYLEGYCVNGHCRLGYSGEFFRRTAQVVFEDGRLDFPDLSQDLLHSAAVDAQRKDGDRDEHIVIDSWKLIYSVIPPRFRLFRGKAKPDVDFVNGEVEPLMGRTEGEGTEEPEIAESKLNPGPSRKRQKKEKTPTGERGNKKTTRVKNVIPLDKILQVKEMSLKGAAKLLKVSRSGLKRACRVYGINIWPPRNKHENIGQSLPNKTPAFVEQEGIPQLTSDTLPSDQASTATGDTNIVAVETPPLQLSSTFQQENLDEDSNNDEVEPVGMGVVGTGKEIVPLKEIHLKDVARELKVDDEEGFPQLNSDTLPSDQASAVTVDMNSVVEKVIQPLQFLPTTQQENEDEIFGNDEVEEVQICLERTENDGMSLKDAAKDLNVVDEEGSPQLINSDNLPSVQAAAVTVDTNSVVGKEIPPLQFSRTAQQKNSDEAFVNEEGEIWAKTIEENGIADVQFDSRCSAKRKRKEKNPRRERRNKKTTGVRIGTPLDDILQTKGRSSLKDDAKHRKEGTSRNTSRGGLAGSNVDVNTAGGQASSKKRLTSFSGKRVSKPCFRSSLGGIMTLIKELNLRTCHKEVLKRTPFWRMFEAIIENKLSPTQCHQRGKMIIEIINTYDPVTGKFRLGRQSIELTRANMVSIFGISCGKEFVSLKYGCKEDVKLVARREISESRLTSTSLKQLLEKYEGSDEKDDVEDVARLLCVYLCHTFFFPTGTTVKWVYLERIEDLDRLRDYDWNEAIINELMSSIRKHHREPRKVTGCVIALMYWLCERTNLSKADDSEHPLGIVKWNIPVVVSKLKKIRLKDLKPHQVVSRQANVAGTADDEVSVDKDIVQDSVSSRDVPVSNQGNNACSGNEKMDEKTRRGERVSRSKLKRVRRDYNMNKWPPREVQKLIGQSQPNESPAVDDQERIPQLNSDTPLPSNQNSGTSNTNCVTVMAKYKGLRIKFQLSWPWRKLELEQQVKKRLQLDATTYYINYKDEDDEMTLIGCDEDLEDYISSTSHLGTRSIDLFLEPK